MRRYEKPVALGAALLNKKMPTWRKKLAGHSQMDMGSVTDCVLALLYGHFEAGLEALESWKPSLLTEDPEWFVTHGFDTPDHMVGEEEKRNFKLLTKEWKSRYVDGSL